MMQSKVYLVGSGAGDPGLLTCRGRELLGKADEVYYDRLLEPALLNYVKSGCKLVYVGKKPGAHSMGQAEINRRLVEAAEENEVVVRLKGGDPLIFGRGGEEADYLKENGVKFEIVPGISSALAAPAYAGIPLTHRGIASSFTVLTGHHDPEQEDNEHNWKALAQGSDTLVILMGVGNFPGIQKQLLENGRDPETPVAFIERGTWPEQNLLISRLGMAAEEADQAGIKPPAIIVVGEVVGLQARLSWNKDLLLEGYRILNTRPAHQARVLTELLEDEGAVVREAPAISIEPPADYAELDQALTRLEEYSWVIFTSTNGVDNFFARMRANGHDIRELAGVKLAAIGRKTAAALEELGLRLDFVPEEYVAEGLVDGFGPAADGEKVLLPRTPMARDTLAVGLEEKGYTVDELTAYLTEEAELPEDVQGLIDDGMIDIVTLTSSSTVRSLVKSAGGAEKLAGIIGAAIGPITAETAREAGLKVPIVAEEYTIEGLRDAILDYVRNVEGGHK
ncbi:MAG: uroporphyrinogen-III C-methyltransferase [Halarsenatibacteraceae bacterium]